MSLNLSAVSAAKARIDAAVAPSAAPAQIPGVNFRLVDRDNNALFSHSAGVRSTDDPSQPMTDDTVFWVASFTKAITGTAAMQLVEQGKIGLDDADALYKYIPELHKTKVLDGWEKKKNEGSDEEEEVPIFREPKTKITLRNLLTHTSGFSYPMLTMKLMKWGMQDPAYRLSLGTPNGENILETPLVADPGTQFNYGLSMDVAGILVERISGLKLHDYFQQNIFKPLGMKDTSFFPTESMKSRLIPIHARAEDGSLKPRDHVVQQSLVEGANPTNSFSPGGGGLFSTITDYTAFLSAVFLRNGGGILRPETVDLMFQNHLPEGVPADSDWSRKLIPCLAPGIMTDVTAWYDKPGRQHHGLSFVVHDADVEGARRKGTALWSGMANCHWWADRITGVAGVITAGVFPFIDLPVERLRDEVEKDLYGGLHLAN